MIKKFANVQTVYEWADVFLTLDYFISRYLRGVSGYRYDVTTECYIHGAWNYFSDLM